MRLAAGDPSYPNTQGDDRVFTYKTGVSLGGIHAGESTSPIQCLGYVVIFTKRIFFKHILFK